MKISILGVGRIGASHAATLAALPGVSQLTVYDTDLTRATAVAASVGARAVGTIDDAFAAAKGIVIVTPTDTHAGLIKRAMDQGLPTFCEKPIATGLAATRDIVDHVARTRGQLQIGFQRRFDPGYRKARAELRGGTLGAVYSFVSVSCDVVPPSDAYIKTSGGQFKDQFIHDFDITRWLFGQEVIEVTATGSTKGVAHYEAMADVGTSGVLLRLADGTIGVMTALRHNEAGYDNHVEIHCAKDTLAIGIDPRTPWRSVEADAPSLAGPRYPSFIVRFGEAYRAELAHFLQFATGNAENPCTAQDGLEALRIAEAAGRSLRERRPVALSEIG